LSSGQPRPLEHHALAWASPRALSGFPMGKLDRQIANSLNQ
jgi:hypothetical protein